MKIGVLKEIKENEYRVSAVPATVQEITRHGHTVYVEAGAGVGSGFSDAEYEAAGAMIADADTVWRESDIYYKVKELFPQEFKWMKKDKILFTYIHSNAHPAETDCLLDSHVSAVAYEDVPDKNGRFPLLRPMSELAGKGGFLAALHYMQAVNGGPGKLLANVAGVERPIITCLGCGNIGIGVAELACGMGNEVRILDVNMDVMLEAKKYLPDVSFMISNRANLEKCLKESDVIINGIQWAKDRKDHIIYREDLKLMKRGSIIVDVACDDNGAVETCRSTTCNKNVFYCHYRFPRINATVNDIAENPHNVKIVELEAAQVARVVDETAFVVLNGNYALAAGFSVGKDALAYEKSDSEAAKTYVNVIAVKEGNEDSAKIKALVDVLKSDDVKKYINDTYDGAVLPYEE